MIPAKHIGDGSTLIYKGLIMLNSPFKTENSNMSHIVEEIEACCRILAVRQMEY
ncbi:MAG: hypothetical protein Q8930_15415 [Bacillota bacterium]|nr:hypothetical protein [Bacillota bacterium]